MTRPSRITRTEGATTFEGPSAVELFRLLSLVSALKLEDKGIKIRRGFSALKLAQKTTGLKTRQRPAQIAALEPLIAALRLECDPPLPERSMQCIYCGNRWVSRQADTWIDCIACQRRDGATDAPSPHPLCERCGSVAPVGESCGCFDNGCS